MIKRKILGENSNGKDKQKMHKVVQNAASFFPWSRPEYGIFFSGASIASSARLLFILS
jgi:queuine/archaeosine tRNA-ribosyltransferase